jgi:hypothetical protein
MSNVSLVEIADMVSRVYGVSLDAMSGPARRGKWTVNAEARYCVVHLAMTHTDVSLTTIAALFDLKRCENTYERFRVNAARYERMTRENMMTLARNLEIEDEIDALHEARSPIAGFRGVSHNWAAIKGTKRRPAIHAN